MAMPSNNNIKMALPPSNTTIKMALPSSNNKKISGRLFHRNFCIKLLFQLACLNIM